MVWGIAALLLGALLYAMRGLGYRVSFPEFLALLAAAIAAGWFNQRFPGKRNSRHQEIERGIDPDGSWPQQK